MHVIKTSNALKKKVDIERSVSHVIEIDMGWFGQILIGGVKAIGITKKLYVVGVDLFQSTHAS